MIGNVIKDNYFSADGLGSKQKFYWEKYIQEGRLNQDLIKKDKNAMDFIIESAHQYPGKLGIIAIGPLTNLSVAYHLDNSIVEKICIVSIMGGSITGMGIRHFFSAEFNFFLDAQAAKIIIDVVYSFNKEILECSDRGFRLCTVTLARSDQHAVPWHKNRKRKVHKWHIPSNIKQRKRMPMWPDSSGSSVQPWVSPRILRGGGIGLDNGSSNKWVHSIWLVRDDKQEATGKIDIENRPEVSCGSDSQFVSVIFFTVFYWVYNVRFLDSID